MRLLSVLLTPPPLSSSVSFFSLASLSSLTVSLARCDPRGDHENVFFHFTELTDEAKVASVCCCWEGGQARGSSLTFERNELVCFS